MEAKESYANVPETEGQTWLAAGSTILSASAAVRRAFTPACNACNALPLPACNICPALRTVSPLPDCDACPALLRAVRRALPLHACNAYPAVRIACELAYDNWSSLVCLLNRADRNGA
jgi:hypothetical protein